MQIKIGGLGIAKEVGGIAEKGGVVKEGVAQVEGGGVQIYSRLAVDKLDVINGCSPIAGVILQLDGPSQKGKAQITPVCRGTTPEACQSGAAIVVGGVPVLPLICEPMVSSSFAVNDAIRYGPVWQTRFVP